MELKNYLRHEYVAKRRQGDQKMFEDQLFDIMQVNLAHQLHDKGHYNRLYLPIDMEALGCDDFVMEPELYHLFNLGHLERLKVNYDDMVKLVAIDE